MRNIEFSEPQIAIALFIISALAMLSLDAYWVGRYRRVLACLTLVLIGFANYLLVRNPPKMQPWSFEPVVAQDQGGGGGGRRRVFKREGGGGRAERDGNGGIGIGRSRGGNGTGKGGALPEEDEIALQSHQFSWPKLFRKTVERKPLPPPFQDCADCPEMVVLPAGFYMAPRTRQVKVENGYPDEPRSIRFERPFAIARGEITVAQYRTFATETKRPAAACDDVAGRTWINPGVAQNADHPVVCITPPDADAYAAWLAEKTQRVYLVASETEWGYAGEGLGEAKRVASAARTVAPAGTRSTAAEAESEVEVTGIDGNAAEIVADCWRATLDRTPTDGRPHVYQHYCDARVVKGGGWRDGDNETNTSLRRPLGPKSASSGVSFRVSAPAEPTRQD
jgi:formylglycine-generating enzyme required for sulfatase activity